MTFFFLAEFWIIQDIFLHNWEHPRLEDPVNHDLNDQSSPMLVPFFAVFHEDNLQPPKQFESGLLLDEYEGYFLLLDFFLI